MNARTHEWGCWQQPWKVTKALCADGVRRTAWITAPADTFFSIPARVKVKGRTVSGYITGREAEDGGADYEFRAAQTRKHYNLLPNR